MIPKVAQLSDLKDLSQFYRLPDDWYIAIADIAGSTKAVSEGKYKQVNMVAASGIIAVLNNTRASDIAYVFGGDGATFLIPNKEMAGALEGLLGTQKMAREIFGFDLRVGFVPVAEVNRAGKYVYVTKVATNKKLYQSVIVGGGLTYAEKLIKQAGTDNNYLYRHENRVYQADFSGLSCRWQDIPSHKEETVSLLIGSLNPEDLMIYQEVLEFIGMLHGSVAAIMPIIEETMQVTAVPQVVEKQIEVANFNKSESGRRVNELVLRGKMMFFKLASSAKIGIGALNLASILKREIIHASDYLKIDDALRMVVALDTASRVKLERYLERKFKQRKLVYGVHISDRAHMTCIVFNRFYQHVHFIDGADGGYTMAAAGFKKRLKELDWISHLNY